MINLDELIDILNENESLVGGIRYIAEYMVKKKYCCHRDLNCNNFERCIECWMMKLTDEVENNKSKGKINDKCKF